MRRLALALAALLLAPAAANAETYRLGSGDWTYFTDPRVVSLGGAVYTGWISTSGRVTVAKFVPSTGRHHTVVVGSTGVDDHNNPSLLVREDGRLMVFFSPHSGYVEPRGRVSRLYYRVATRRHSIARWGPTHHLPVNAPGRLGYTYPNPIALPGGRIWLSWRGGRWLPTYSIYKGGRWAPAHEIVHGPDGQRPYAKYAAGPAGRGVVHMAFTETHPSESRTHVHYLQYRLGRGFFRADGRRAGSAGDLPLTGDRSDLVRRYHASDGRAWVMDVADDGAGRPVIVYSVGFGRSRQAFRFARWTGERWLDRRITSAYGTVRHGRRAGLFQTGGIVLDHRDPSIVYLSRIVGDRGRIEAWRTADGGRTWERLRRLSPAGQNCYRPAAPVSGSQRVVLFVCGYQSHWKQYATTIRCALPDRRDIAWSYGWPWRAFPDGAATASTYRRDTPSRRSTCPFGSPSTVSAASGARSSAPPSSARSTTASSPSTT
jgi:hypothetical protein